MESNEGTMLLIFFVGVPVALILVAAGRRMIAHLLCRRGFHSIMQTEILDEARIYAWCDRCGAHGVLDSQGQLP